MKHRHERRPLPALRHVGGAKIMDDPDPESSARRRAVADLHGQAVPGPVQNGLAVKADKIDRGAVDGVRHEKGFDRFRMTAGDHRVGQRQAARPRAAIVERRRRRNGAAQQCPVRLGIGKKSGAAKRDDLLPVGLDDRDIDAVHRGAAHQAYRADRSNWLSPPRVTGNESVLNYLQIAFNARHSPNERKGSPAGALSALSSIASRSAVIGCEAKIDRCQLRSSLTIRLSFVGVHIYVFVGSSSFRPNLRAAAVALPRPSP